MTPETFSMTFDFGIVCSSKRIIEGVASLPTVDRQKEVIMKSAIKDALDGFMELPILHFRHTERPIGLVTKAYVGDDGLHVRARIREANGSDEVWKSIVSGDYGKFSIYGRRRTYSPECRLSITSRTEESPCITKSMYLDSISIVETTEAANLDTWLTVTKALAESQENYINDEKVTESVIQDVSVQDRGYEMVDVIPEPVEEQGDTAPETEPIEKSEPETPAYVNLLMEKLDEVLTTRLAPIEKMMTEAEPETEPINDVETIVKARVASEVEEIKKSFDDQITKLTERIEKMEQETIRKGGNPVIIQDEFTSAFGNSRALREFDEVR